MHIDWQDNDWVIHRRLVEQMDERLHILKTAPEHITLVGADGNISHQALQTRFPQALITEIDERPEYLALSAEERASKRSMWQKLLGKKTTQIAGSLVTTGTPASADLLWSNLAFVAQNEPTELFEHWSQILKKDGLLFFTHFGPDTLQEVTQLLRSHGIGFEPKRFWDMHDLGDMLFHHGFYDPVMDVERIHLTYQQPQRFWRDMEILSLWHSLNIAPKQTELAQTVLNQAILSGELAGITLEVVFGHAVKKLRLPDNEALVNFYPSKP